MFKEKPYIDRNAEEIPFAEGLRRVRRILDLNEKDHYIFRREDAYTFTVTRVDEILPFARAKLPVPVADSNMLGVRSV